MKKSRSLNSISIAVATLAGLTLASVSAQADPQGRALGHVKQFAGSSLHGQGHEYRVRDIITDADGTEHVRFDRTVNGLRVIGGDLVVRSDRNGALQAMHLTLKRDPQVDAKPTISLGQAKQLAAAKHGGADMGVKPELVIYARGDQPRLAWDVLVGGEESDGTPFEKHAIIDAQTGSHLDMWNDIHTAAATGTGKSLYSGTVTLTTNSISGGYELRDPSRGSTYTTNMNKKTAGNGTIFTDTDNVWGSSTTADLASAAVDAQYGTAVTWDYYKNVHGRSGIANDGKGAFNRVHYGRNYANAFWSDSCFCMTYGDGDGTSLKSLVSLDVAGHEMTHGVTSRTANLTYSGESGGLNEATSDIFGSMVEFYAANGNDAGDYLIGEKVMVRSAFLRNMMKPSADGASADCWYSGVGSLDVHYSSGVANHFYFMLAEGTNSSLGTSPTCKAGDTRVATGTGTLTGIGRDAAAKIWYRALTTKMTSSTNYAGARAATIAAANELYGAGSTQANAVAAAWTAVNVN
ncbi:M4 family metallopeptidase [Mitsuaria sp. WAJ17]|uniref:M4 family metallopeptidase n=1 Tax=Mitsuaria sp. WAJ17 TaxID=2761452 RepID=UPI0015FECE56|nr:M4 family metallopeptidase [Mitsuaria sp. WAJ17]MBB2487996.1 M4 family metallopeptidase [Mitsuaria sp. WAJ17]